MTNCPDPEVLGAFIDGRLRGEPLAAMKSHLATCDDCLAVMEAAEPAPAIRFVTPRAPRRWILAAAAAIVIAIGLGALFVRRGFTPDGMTRLADAAPKSYRTVEPRLTGFRWSELRRLRAGEQAAPDSEWLQLAGAAGKALERADDDPHAAGVAELLVDQPSRAVERLRALTTRDPDDAAAWSDLAAAYYTSATRSRKTSDLPLALAAADRAIALDPKSGEARFNRALILERMSLGEEAAAAWREYLAIDPDSGWAAEARRRLEILSKPRASFDRRALEQAALRGDHATVRRMVGEHREQSRKWFETDVLGRWGETRDAALLDAARLVGDALREINGDALLAESVSAIAANSDVLARAHTTYRRGRLHYRAHELREAEADLLAAAGDFERGRSPMAGVSLLFASSVLFDENRVDEAAVLLERVLAQASPAHLSLIAETHQQLARCATFDGRWSDARAHATEAAAILRRLGETPNLSLSVAALGDAWAGSGNRDAAWEQRLAALQLLAEIGAPDRVHTILTSAARFELRDERLDAAAALLRVETEQATRIGAPLLVADVYRRSALLRGRSGDEAAGLVDLRAARQFVAREQTSGLRQRVEQECAIAEAVLVRGSDARRSIALLSTAIDFLRDAGERFVVSEALLERARSHRAAGDRAAALTDYAGGLAEIEQQRHGASATAIFDTATSLLDESVQLLLENGEAPEAFATAERVHARSLADAFAVSPPAAAAVAREMPARSALVEYVLLPRGIAAFCVTGRGLSHALIPAERADVEASISALRNELARRGDVTAIRAAAARLHRQLIEPLSALANAESIVIVPDRALQGVPWAALYDERRGQYLIERAAITVAPSAGLWMRNRGRGAPHAGDRLLLITNDSRAELDLLDNVRREIDAVGALYANRVVLAAADATPARFAATANECDVLHFAGHARGGATGEAALLVAGELRASDIARAALRRPRLAVLAACDTMSGDAATLDGMPGLARAFLAAGVPAVIGTLWPVDDAQTATLLAAFHERFRDGASPALALRDAQRSMIRAGGAAAHPASWAAAELLGTDT